MAPAECLDRQTGSSAQSRVGSWFKERCHRGWPGCRARRREASQGWWV